ncbi:ankyrin repeat-containing domain protein [Trichoderma chlorosporum]
MSRQAPFLFLILWLAGHVSADGGDDFANNLASDLGPIIALFGERVVMQFMSQAMGLTDCVLLAVAPIGAITIIVSAIRVAGPAWLRSFIGRARENLQAAEIDVMSSTSKEVCELWNGNSVVRCPGSADISQFIYLEKDSGELRPSMRIKTKISMLSREKEKTSRQTKVDPLSNPSDSDKHPAVYVVMDRLNEDAPNLLLNCHDRVGRMEMYLATIFGTILQLGALIYFGLITYHQPILGQFLKDGKRAVGYAFPCAAAGTVLLAFGLFLCGWVVQKSTTETCYQADGHQIFIVWLQKDHTVSDQVFKPFAICPTSNREYIILSRRNDQLAKQKIKEEAMEGREDENDGHEIGEDEREQSWPLGLIAAFGALVSLVGFISQFVGMRGLSWTASIVQLGVTIIMTVIRVIVRRGLGKNPIRVRLKSNFELDWFALSFGDLSKAIWARAEESGGDSWKWSVKTGGEQAYSTLKKTDDNDVPIDKFSKAHKMMVVRQNLGKLSNWRSPIREEAARLSTAIELVAQTFLERGSDTTLWWKIPAIYEDREEHIYIKLERKGTKWSINVEEIDAILSLWLYSVSSAEEVANARQRCNVRLFGSSRFKKRLLRDLRWWVPEVIPEIDTLTKAEIEDKYSGCSVVGFTSETGNKKKNSNNIEIENEPEEYLVLECQDTQERLFSRDLLFSFIRAAAKLPGFISPIALSRGRMKATEMAKGWKKMKIKDDNIVTLARKIENIGFGTPSDVYFDLIASLSLEQKLIINNIRDEAINQVQEHGRSCHWKQLVDSCSFLLDLAYEFDLEKEPSGPLVIAVCFGTLDGLRYEAQLQSLEGRIEKTLETQLKILEEKFYIFENSTLSAWMKIGSPDKCYSITVFDRLIGSSIDKEKEFPDSFKVTSEHLKITRTDDLAESVCLQSGGLEKVDSFGWSLLHYAKSAPQMGEVQRGLTSKLEIGSLQDYRGWTPLQYACLVGNEKAVDLLLGHHAQIDKAGVDGITPIHCAVEGENAAILRKLLEKFDSKQQNSVLPLDRNERHPIHWAAVRGKVELVELLKDGINLKDRFGWTCLHLAVIHKHEKLCHYIARQSEADINMRDNDSRTPLHLAIEFKSPAVLEVLLSARADVNAKSKDGSTPLHMAVEQTQILQKLLKRGADVDAVDVEGRTPLYQAAAAGNADATALLIAIYRQKWENATTLLNANADIKADHRGGYTPLLGAVVGRNLEIVNRLLTVNADVQVADEDGNSPLHLAVSGDDISIIEGLLTFGADIDAVNAVNGQTPWHVAVVKGFTDTVALLLEKKAKTGLLDRFDFSPLQYALYYGNLEIVRLLVKHESGHLHAKIKGSLRKSRGGDTPLHTLCRWGRNVSDDETMCAIFDELRSIISRNDLNTKDRDGYRPLDLAVSVVGGYRNFIKKLVDEGAESGSNESEEEFEVWRNAMIREEFS